jgi:hypothetical protein
MSGIAVPSAAVFNRIIHLTASTNRTLSGERMSTTTFYTMFSDTQFLHIGTFCSVAVQDDISYFQWGTGWNEIEPDMFAYFRDGGDIHFNTSSFEDVAMLVPEAYSAAGSLQDAVTARAIATAAHVGQVDKLGNDYIEHPARVAATFDRFSQSTEHCAAWLHDVLEDTTITAEDLLDAGVQREVLEAVLLLTRRNEVPTDLYYSRIREHPVARAVKLADIADNTAEWRIRQLDPDARVRLAEKYAKALAALELEETK